MHLSKNYQNFTVNHANKWHLSYLLLFKFVPVWHNTVSNSLHFDLLDFAFFKVNFKISDSKFQGRNDSFWIEVKLIISILNLLQILFGSSMKLFSFFIRSMKKKKHDSLSYSTLEDYFFSFHLFLLEVFVNTVHIYYFIFY